MPGAVRRYDHRIGRIIRAHGLDGSVVLQLFRPRRVEDARLRWRRVDVPQPVELELGHASTELHGVAAAKFVDGSTALVRLADVRDRDAAERLVPSFFDVDPADPPQLVTDDVDRLFGAEVFVDDEETPLGRVEDIRDNGAQALLLVGEEEIMIPVIDAFVRSVEQCGEGTKVHVRSIPGLLEANRRPMGADSDG
jgi:ribosomal 30S subunit maturation factor RimM